MYIYKYVCLCVFIIHLELYKKKIKGKIEKNKQEESYRETQFLKWETKTICTFNVIST